MTTFGIIDQPPCLGDTPIMGVMHTDLIGDLEIGPFVGEIPQPFGDIGQPPCKGYIDQTGIS